MTNALQLITASALLDSSRLQISTTHASLNVKLTRLQTQTQFANATKISKCPWALNVFAQWILAWLAESVNALHRSCKSNSSHWFAETCSAPLTLCRIPVTSANASLDSNKPRCILWFAFLIQLAQQLLTTSELQLAINVPAKLAFSCQAHPVLH